MKTKLISHISKSLQHLSRIQRVYYTTTTQPVKLYAFGPSTCSWRVRAALYYKGIPYETINIQLTKNDQYQESFGKLNAMMQVPVLEIDGKILTQSLPIIEYLDETRPAPALLPNDKYLRYRARQIAEIINAGIQPLQNMSTLRFIAEDKRKEALSQWIRKGFSAIEKIVSETEHRFCVGDHLTIADICLIPQAYAAQTRTDIDLMKEFPRIYWLYESGVSMRYFAETHPEFINSK